MTKRKQRSQAQWLELIAQQKQIGLKASEFCRQQGFSDFDVENVAIKENKGLLAA